MELLQLVNVRVNVVDITRSIYRENLYGFYGFCEKFELENFVLNVLVFPSAVLERVRIFTVKSNSKGCSRVWGGLFVWCHSVTWNNCQDDHDCCCIFLRELF